MLMLFTPMMIVTVDSSTLPYAPLNLDVAWEIGHSEFSAREELIV